MPKHAPTDPIRFEMWFWQQFSDPDPKTDCIEWQRGKNNRGYGAVVCNKRQILTHRVAYELTHGPIPKGKHILHTCDNPPCGEPTHLVLGNAAKNRRHSDERGRSARGEDHGRAKLTEIDVRLIRQTYALGDVTQVQLAECFGVTKSNINLIVHRIGWKHIW